MKYLACAATVLFLVGCGASGPATYPIAGTANFDGKPIEMCSQFNVRFKLTD